MTVKGFLLNPSDFIHFSRILLVSVSADVRSALFYTTRNTEQAPPVLTAVCLCPVGQNVSPRGQAQLDEARCGDLCRAGLHVSPTHQPPPGSPVATLGRVCAEGFVKSSYPPGHLTMCVFAHCHAVEKWTLNVETVFHRSGSGRGPVLGRSVHSRVCA